MLYTYYFGNIELQCNIEETEIDNFDPMSGHYTTKGDYFVESVTHKGGDITEIIDESILDDIVRAFVEGE